MSSLTIEKLKFVVSEKSSAQMAQNKYTFIVKQNINKIYLKQYFKTRFGVDVLSVNTANFAGKKRKRGKASGRDNCFKKVVISLKPGQEIKDYKEAY